MKILIVSADRTEQHGGAANLGDALLTDALCEALRDRGQEPTIYDFGDVARRGSTDRTGGPGLRALVRAMRSSDAVVLGGGTLLQDNVTRVAAGLPRLCWAVSMTAWILRVPLAYFGVGCDPMPRRHVRLMLRMAVAGRTIWVRDMNSLDRVQTLLHKRAHLGGDAALLAPPSADATERHGIVLALSADSPEEASATQLKALREMHGSARFVAMAQHHNTTDAATLSTPARQEIDVSPGPIHWRTARDEISRAEVLIASRMHALYLAAGTGTPAVALGSQPKVLAFASEFSVPTIASLSSYRSGMAQVPSAEAIDAASRRVREALESMLEGLRR